MASSLPRSIPKQLPLPLSRRLLFPALPPDAPLPPLVPGPELDDELYNLIALLLRAYVIPWWSKITRYDKELLPEINRLVALVIRALHSRLAATDLSPLIYHDVPVLITQHYRDIRNASSKLSTSYAAGASASLPVLFHQLQPHMAIDGESIDEMYIRHVLDHILKSCLPPEDYAPEAERFIIREVALKVVLQDVIPKITEPWFLYKTVLDLVGPVEDKPRTKPDTSASTFSFHALLVLFLSAVQSISGTCLALIHAYKQALSTIKAVHHTPRPATSPPSSPSSSLSPPTPDPTMSDYAHAPLTMIAEIFTTHDRFASNAVMSSVNVLSALFAPFLDRLLPHLLYTHLLSPSRLLHIIRLSTYTLFPNGYPAPPPQIPTLQEQIQIRQELLRRLGDIVSQSPSTTSPGSKRSPSRSGTGTSGLIGRVLLGPTEMGREEVLESVLDGVGDRRCNMHLVLFILDAVVLRVFPELGVGGGVDRGEEVVSPEEMSRSVSAATTTRTRSSVSPPGSTITSGL